jgi:hypothetical protein
MAVHTSDPNTFETETGGSQVQGQPMQHGENLSPKIIYTYTYVCVCAVFVCYPSTYSASDRYLRIDVHLLGKILVVLNMTSSFPCSTPV